MVGFFVQVGIAAAYPYPSEDRQVLRVVMTLAAVAQSAALWRLGDMSHRIQEARTGCRFDR